MKILNYLKVHAFSVAVIVWAVFITCIILFAEPRTVYIEKEPEVVTVTETVEVEVPVEPESKAYYKEISLTEEEWLLLGKITYAEAGNQKPVGKCGVIEVVFNRLLDPRFPDTITGVICQKGQFTNCDWVDEATAREQFVHIETVLNEEVPLLDGKAIYFATYKNANGSHYIQIGDHYFAY